MGEKNVPLLHSKVFLVVKGPKFNCLFSEFCSSDVFDLFQSTSLDVFPHLFHC